MKFPEMNSNSQKCSMKFPKTELLVKRTCCIKFPKTELLVKRTCSIKFPKTELLIKRTCSMKFPKTELAVKRIVPRSSQKLNSQNVPCSSVIWDLKKKHQILRPGAIVFEISIQNIGTWSDRIWDLNPEYGGVERPIFENSIQNIWDLERPHLRSQSRSWDLDRPYLRSQSRSWDLELLPSLVLKVQCVLLVCSFSSFLLLSRWHSTFWGFIYWNEYHSTLAISTQVRQIIN
jgi:hypothetical protein